MENRIWIPQHSPFYVTHHSKPSVPEEAWIKPKRVPEPYNRQHSMNYARPHTEHLFHIGDSNPLPDASQLAVVMTAVVALDEAAGNI